MNKKLLVLNALLLLYSCDYESKQIEEANAIINRIEAYRDSVGTIPESLSDVGVNVKDETDHFYYEREDSVNYSLSFGTGFGNSKTYYSESKEWVDYSM